jgi:ClpP class serine protease
MHDLFVDAIAGGRKTTAKKVNAEFGQGATLLAEEALKRGMIDSIGAIENVIKPNSRNVGTTDNLEVKTMDLKTLKSQHPDVYAEATQEARKEGVQGERDRVTAHLTAGELSGDMKTALQCAKDGTEMTMTLQTQYMMATANRTQLESSQQDSDSANAGDNAHVGDQVTAGESVANMVEANLGLGVK